jgi:phage shock protein PspC (stress-responsive transcriptional regulator)
LTGVIPGLLAYAAAWIIVPLEPQPVQVHRPAEQPHEGTA